MGVLPNVRIGLRDFAIHIHILLQTHSGSLPLPRYGIQFIALVLQQFVSYIKVKGKLPLCAINRALSHEDVGVGGGITPVFLTTALDGNEWSA
jgi:hypothetical protein